MQLVGKSCQVCGEKVKVALDVQGCERCVQVFHEACLDDRTTCPTCSQPFPVEEKPSTAPAVRTCPVCGAVSPPSALTCDCGHDLRSTKNEQLRRENRKQHRGWIVVGLGMIAMSVIITVVTLSAEETEGIGIFFYGLFIGGCAVAANGYRMLRRLR